MSFDVLRFCFRRAPEIHKNLAENGRKWYVVFRFLSGEGFELKKLLAAAVCIAIFVGMFAGFTITASAFTDYDYVTFTATGNDPYAVFKFGSKGQNKKIDPDTVGWAAIRYRTRSQYDTDGIEYRGQLYIMPFVEPYIPITYKFTGQWETAVIDLTTVSEDTILDSKWDSEFYTTRNQIRFDPLESSRDAEEFDDDYDALVEVGAQIDIAWIAFFEKEADARSYMGREGVPYCVLGPGALSKLQSPVNNLEVERITLDTPEPGSETPTPAPTETPAVTETPEATEAPTATPTGTPQETPKDTKTEAPKDDKPSGNGSSGGKGGCGGAVIGGTAVIALAAAALVLRKKH